MKKRIRLTESDLHRIIKESVNQIIDDKLNTKYVLDRIMKVIYSDNNLSEYKGLYSRILMNSQNFSILIAGDIRRISHPTFVNIVETLVEQFDNYALNVLGDIKYEQNGDQEYFAFIDVSVDKTHPIYQEAEEYVYGEENRKDNMMKHERRMGLFRRNKENKERESEQEEQLRQEREKEEREKILSRIASSRKPYPQKKREKGKYDDVVPQKTITQLPSSDTKSYYRTNDDFYWNK